MARMKERQLQDSVDLEAALGAHRYLLLKHSKTCGISASAYKAVDAFLAAHTDVASGWIEVREQRPLSNEIEARTGIPHESPQAFWIVDGQVAWHASHFDISKTALADATAG